MRLSRRTTIILASCSAVFLLSQWLFVPKTYVNSRLISALQAPAVFIRSLQNRSQMLDQLAELTLENQSLRGQLSELAHAPTRVIDSVEYLRASVYSSYPFNNVDKVVINAGSAEGVRPGMLVVARPGVFFGEVVSVDTHTSEVETVLSPSVRLEVRIGKGNISSLLEGGHEPRLTLISKKKPAATHEQVIIASKKYPAGLLLGTVGALTTSDDNLFEEAVLKLSYTVSELTEVFVVL